MYTLFLHQVLLIYTYVNHFQRFSLSILVALPLRETRVRLDWICTLLSNSLG